MYMFSKLTAKLPALIITIPSLNDKMASGSKLTEALQTILNVLNETNCTDVDIETIEAENAQLRQKKIELMGKLYGHSTVNSSIVLVEDMLTRQQSINQARSEIKKCAAMRSNERLLEADAHIASWTQKMKEINNFLTLPHNEVVQKISEMDEKTTANIARINELIQEETELKQNYQKRDENILNLNKTLKYVEDDQRKLLNKLKEETHTELNVQLPGFEENLTK